MLYKYGYIVLCCVVLCCVVLYCIGIGIGIVFGKLDTNIKYLTEV